MVDIDIIICLGKNIYPDGSIDYALRGRVDTAVKLWQEHPDAKLLFAGGKGLMDSRNTGVTEAKSMLYYAKQKFPDLDYSKILLEEESKNTIDQFIKIKTEICIPQKLFNIVVVTDDIHMPRAKLTIESIFGTEFQISCVEFTIDLVGKYKNLLVENEKELINSTKEKLITNIQPGDHLAWKKWNDEYMKNKS